MTVTLTRPVRALIFDLDGTLIDSAADLACAANRMLAALGHPRCDEGLLATFIGKGMARLVERSLAGQRDGVADPELLASAIPVFERFYAEESGRQGAVYPGVVAGLEALKNAGVPLACITNKPERFTVDLLEKTGLARYFDLVVGGDTLARKKPDPLPFAHVCERFGVLPGEALMVGDSENDVLGARAAGCPVVCVPYGYNEGRPIEAAGCDAIVATVLEAAMLALESRARAYAGVAP